MFRVYTLNEPPLLPALSISSGPPSGPLVVQQARKLVLDLLNQAVEVPWGGREGDGWVKE